MMKWTRYMMLGSVLLVQALSSCSLIDEPETIGDGNVKASLALNISTVRSTTRMADNVTQVNSAREIRDLKLFPFAVQGMQVFTSGFASGFNINDSTFAFRDKTSVVKTDELDVKNDRQLCFCSVNFPSREPEMTRTVIETTEPFIAQENENSLWEFQVYVPDPSSAQTRAGRKITRTTLRFRKPLRAGQLRIIKGRVLPDGSIGVEMPEVGVSVTLDWKQGGEYHPNI